MYQTSPFWLTALLTNLLHWVCYLSYPHFLVIHFLVMQTPAVVGACSLSSCTGLCVLHLSFQWLKCPLWAREAGWSSSTFYPPSTMPCWLAYPWLCRWGHDPVNEAPSQRSPPKTVPACWRGHCQPCLTSCPQVRAQGGTSNPAQWAQHLPTPNRSR